MDVYWIVGTGRIGLSLGSVLSSAGAGELLLVGRREGAPDHPVMESPAVRYASALPGPPPEGTRLLLAVPDGTIANVAAEIAGLGRPGTGCVALQLLKRRMVVEVAAT